ncbi:hypothetical protein MHU86_7580 [Fragilaria crotonensis]|nr:hypothetical protein MHU86_7580 [Fragilaria crotonensis]
MIGPLDWRSKRRWTTTTRFTSSGSSSSRRSNPRRSSALDLKAAIKARHPSQYAGENLEALAADYRKDARELTTAGQYDHNLTLTMLKTFLLAGGAGNEDFRFPLRSTKQKLDQALLDIGYKEKSGAHAHMVAEKLTFQDICRQAEDAYRTQFDRKEWPPASHAPDVRAPSATFGNVATAPQVSPEPRYLR